MKDIPTLPSRGGSTVLLFFFQAVSILLGYRLHKKETLMADNSTDTPTFTSGEWNGFYIEKHNTNRGWMHLYLEIEDQTIKGEGTDYVGPWNLSGTYDEKTAECTWVKKYMGKHNVTYVGKLGPNGITGSWSIGGLLNGPFHIWPKQMTHFNELYMTEDLERQAAERQNDGSNPFGPSMILGEVPKQDYV